MGKGEAEQVPAAISRHQRRSYREFMRIFLIQAILILLVSLACLLHSAVAAYSALLGGMLYLIPGLYFTWRALGNKNANSARHVLLSMYASAIGKMILAVALFSATFMLVQPLSPFSLFGTFMLLQLSGWMLQLKLYKTGS